MSDDVTSNGDGLFEACREICSRLVEKSPHGVPGLSESEELSFEETLLERIRILEEEKGWYEGIIAAIGDGISVQGLDYRVIYQNQPHREMMGDHLGEECFRAYGRRESLCSECFLTVAMEKGTVHTVERCLKNGDTSVHYEITISPLRDSTGTVVAGIEVVRDITARKQGEERLKFLSTHDVLTGLYNRSYFEEELSRLQGGRSYPFSIIMADIDDLKVTNDSRGHAAGDELLSRAAVIFRELFRAEDVVARIGGDEFAALLPNTDAVAADEVLERIRGVLDVWNERYPSPVSLSLGRGTAACREEMPVALKAADDSMYQDKIRRTGRSLRRTPAPDE